MRGTIRNTKGEMQSKKGWVENCIKQESSIKIE